MLQDEGADLRQRVHLAGQHHGALALFALDDLVAEVVLDVLHDLRVVLAPDQALRAVDGVAGVHHHLILGDVPDEQVALLGHGDDGGEDERPAIARDHLGDLVAHVRDARVGRAQVDAEEDGLFRHEFERLPAPAVDATARAPRGATNPL